MRRSILVLAVLIALTRLIALSATLADWDETLFAWGVRDYDITPHHPHPPGYPMFIAAAKVVHWVVRSELRSLQAVATLASMLIFPAVFLLMRELGFRTAAAIAGGALTAFLPTLWYHGGTALSDVPGICAALLASALLLRGARSPAAWWGGIALAIVALSIRPHLIMIIGVAGIASTRSIRRLALSALIGGLGCVLIYGIGLVSSTNFPDGPRKEFRLIREHVYSVDSYHNPARPKLGELAPRIFVTPFGGGRRAWPVDAFAVIALIAGIVKREKKVLIVVAMFLPLAIFTWLMLDFWCLARYSIAFIPMYAMLAAHGIVTVAGWFGRLAIPIAAIVTLAITASLIDWTLPALRTVRREPSPPVAAFAWVREHVPRVGPRVFIANELAMHAEWLLPDYDYKLVFEDTDYGDEDFVPGNIFVIEGYSPQHDARLFARPSQQLAEISRPRYFEVSIIPMHTMPRLLEGWYPEESIGHEIWHWMGADSRTLLPRLHGEGRLKLSFGVPTDTGKQPLVTLLWNGTPVYSRKITDPNLEIALDLESGSRPANELRVTTDAPVFAPGDPRPLGLKLMSISWEPASALQ